MQLSKKRTPKLRIVPLATVDTSEIAFAYRTPSNERVWCSECGKLYAGGSIVNDPPFIDDENQLLMPRRCYCDHCNHLLMWFEFCDTDGKPIGKVCGELAIIRARSAVEHFLAKHPWAAGISQDAGHY